MPVYISDEFLARLIEEDVSYGDLTTEILGIGKRKGRMLFSTREPTVLCCTEEAGKILQKLGATIRHLVPSGEYLPAGVDFLEVEGTAQVLHAGWRATLNLMEHLSGIATRTRRIVDIARGINPGISIASTRKSFPGSKKLSLKAVICGGARPHRLGLSETVLIFKHHLVFMESMRSFFSTIERLRQAIPSTKLVIEVENNDEALMAAEIGFDMIQIDKMPAVDLEKLVMKVRSLSADIKIAAAGGINETNAAEYARTGVDVLVLSSVYSGKPSDIGVRIFSE
ncbi:MAG TPA: ModD protein [Geobacteraceae bacterium]|nr:ModD protein [Geobacteraceae bacterium]